VPTDDPRADWVVVVPLKPLSRAKSRLPGRPDADRGQLARAFALDTVRAAAACPQVASVVVVTDDQDVRDAVTALGASWTADAGGGLNLALDAAAAQVRASHPESHVAALLGDLPSLRPLELSAALELAADVPRGFVADASGIGTTLLTAGPGAQLECRFGPRSRAAHAASGAVALEPGIVPGLRRDVDTDVDLWDAQRLGVGPATAALLTR